MISAGDFRNGVTFEMDGKVYQIVEFQHVKPGKGAAFVRTKLKNVITGAVVEKTFRPTEKMEKAHVERKDMQYSYSDGDLYYFMDQETFDIIFMDPPYAAGLAEPTLEKIVSGGLLVPEGMVIVERSAQIPLAPIKGLYVDREKNYKTTVITFLRPEESAT